MLQEANLKYLSVDFLRLWVCNLCPKIFEWGQCRLKSCIGEGGENMDVLRCIDDSKHKTYTHTGVTLSLYLYLSL